MSWLTRLLTFTFTITLLAACGFTPMYASGSGSAPDGLDKVEIAVIPNEEGVFLRNALIDTFYRDGYPSSPQYVLDIREINDQVTDLDMTVDSEATRKQIKLRTRMSLRNKETGEEVLMRDLTALSSYNVLGSQFTTRVSENDARDAALNDLARQIETQVSLYFKRQ